MENINRNDSNLSQSWYEGKDKKIKSSAEFNSALQGAYFIMATRSIGLDCCPIMLGFKSERKAHFNRACFEKFLINFSLP